MDPTTLVTFFFKAPPTVHVVELLGSWDNFSQPYRMHHDRRRGNGSYAGCFKFEDIIFDDDTSHYTRPRSGGLKQGGTYWYFYRLNYDVEAFDDSMPATAACPLLPGQMVNVMEVPTEIVQPPSRCRSACYDVGSALAKLKSLQTLDPTQKFAILEPPPVSKVHERCLSDLALNGRLESKPVLLEESLASPAVNRSGEYAAVDDSERRPLSRRLYSAGVASAYSNRSWRSAQSSYANSSVVDAYAVESIAPEDEVDLLDCFPLPGSGSDSIAPALNGELAVHGGFVFDFRDDPSPTSDAPPDTVANDSSDAVEMQQVVHARDSYHADAIHNDQICGSDTAEQWLPEMYALPDSEDDDPCIQQGALSDLCSPCFSAKTISSGGLNTPFRLSAAYPRATSASVGDTAQQALDDVTDRLQTLDTGAHLLPPPLDAEAEVQPSFSGYALPLEATHSEHSLTKLSSQQSDLFQHKLPLPSGLSDTAAGGVSMVEDIFSELGYLGASIS